MHRSSLVFALLFTSMVAAAPVTSNPAVASTSVSEVAIPANTALAADVIPPVVDSELSFVHVSETTHPSDKRRRSFRRRHP
ncbi:hypothetical protein FB45DRAFT_909472 [Roridomyces roridus]|uniref:Uncharacterized protein n=1 Tax=Roridomyces roridus TaxID=1738132 RepID=A0AAD7BZ66_9AGAR|nr:hypothetical protein FB45DRAFT_909472 [Roridomyces roridus]